MSCTVFSVSRVSWDSCFHMLSYFWISEMFLPYLCVKSFLGRRWLWDLLLGYWCLSDARIFIVQGRCRMC